MASIQLRTLIDNVLVDTSRDMGEQNNVVNQAFARRVAEVQDAKDKLQDNLKKVREIRSGTSILSFTPKEFTDMSRKQLTSVKIPHGLCPIIVATISTDTNNEAFPRYTWSCVKWTDFFATILFRAVLKSSAAIMSTTR